jgi:AraC family transcriptional regulator of arabinose operon
MNLLGINPRFTVGDVVYKKHGHYGPRIQKNLQLVYIFKGDALIRINGKEHYLGPREATLLLPGREEYFTFSRRTRTHHGWCESIEPRLDHSVLREYEQLPFSRPFTPRMELLANTSLSLSNETRASQRRLFDVLAQAIFLEFLSLARFQDDRDEILPVPLQKACDHIETNYASSCDLERLAKIAGVTKGHLIRLFRKHLGVTPIECLWKKRVESGARLLKETGLSISEVAYRTGFQNPYHFSRLAKEHLGESPRQYRQKAWGMVRKIVS